jgi:7,8-dihydropterin-6-yl-methyl-4-(beta-D-ribofuranosyl)aminobenzene 5'-phosphate synthase
MSEADRVEITVLVDNWVDMLLPNEVVGDHCLSRVGLIEHFDPKEQPPQAENGIAFLVRATAGRHTTTVLFDVGLTGKVLAHNFAALHLDPASIDHVAISHGHPDHYGGIFSLLGLRDRTVPVVTHSDAFLPRYALMGDGRAAPFYNAAFRQQDVDDAGGRLVLSRDPLELGYGLITTGEIPRLNDYEGTPVPPTMRSPGLYQVGADGDRRVDAVMDEIALLIHVSGAGVIALTGCAHAGVVNTLTQAKSLLGADTRLLAVCGGFHLGFPTTPAENVTKTVSALNELGLELVMPMHCSGLRAQVALSQQFDGQYVQPSVGTTLRFGG